MRVWDGNIRELQGEYLFALAHVCNVTPEQLPDMRVIHFAILIHGIDQWVAARKAEAEG